MTFYPPVYAVFSHKISSNNTYAEDFMITPVSSKSHCCQSGTKALRFSAAVPPQTGSSGFISIFSEMTQIHTFIRNIMLSIYSNTLSGQIPFSIFISVQPSDALGCSNRPIRRSSISHFVLHLAVGRPPYACWRAGLFPNRPIRPQLDFALRASSRCRASALCMLARRFVSQSSDQTSARFRTSCFISLWGVRPMHDKKGAAFCKLCLQGCTLSIMRRSDLLIQTVNCISRRRSHF